MTDIQPLRPITLEESNGAKWAFRPQSDITPMESVLIGQLFIRMVMTIWQGPVDWPTYMRDHRLERHFLMVETGVPLPKTQVPVEYVAIRDIPGTHWVKGSRMNLLEGMPVPDGFVEATVENIRIVNG